MKYKILTPKGHEVVNLPKGFAAGDLCVVDHDVILKQQGFSTDYPSGGEKKVYHYGVQRHFRGKSDHGDLRNEWDDDTLEGKTLLDQIEDKIKVPVVTLGQAKRLFKDNKEDYWKINWKNGDIKSRETRGGEREHGNIQVVLKAQEPHDWLDAELQTPFPPNWPKTVVEWWGEWDESTKKELRDEGWTKERAQKIIDGDEDWDEPSDVPVGGTKDYPAVFLMIDEGTVEYGARKPWYQEFFYKSDKGLLEGRYIFRMISRKESELLVDKGIIELNKAKRVLPPGEEEEESRSGYYTIMMQPIDQTPYVVAKDGGVDSGWIPPQGWSCIPEEIRDNIPDKYHFWKHDDKEKRIDTRDEFVDKMDVRETLNLPGA